MTYPGGKAGAGVYQALLNQVPPHRTWIELFAGGAALARLKRPAEKTILVDADPEVCADLERLRLPGATVVCADATRWVQEHAWEPGTVCYVDPPYLMDVRTTRREYYRREFHTWEEHARLLSLLQELSTCVPVMISGYWDARYAEKLSTWRAISYTGCSHGGPREEWAWCSYPVPTELHDYRYLGSDYRERERIKRKRLRWERRLREMPVQERYAILAALEAVRSG